MIDLKTIIKEKEELIEKISTFYKGSWNSNINTYVNNLQGEVELLKKIDEVESIIWKDDLIPEDKETISIAMAQQIIDGVIEDCEISGKNDDQYVFMDKNNNAETINWIRKLLTRVKK
jgi:hypothetical protein